MEEPMTSRQVGLNGFEPLTSRLSGVRSNRLSYSPGLYRTVGKAVRLQSFGSHNKKSPKPARHRIVP